MAAHVLGAEALKREAQTAAAELRSARQGSGGDDDDGAGPGPSSSNASRRPSMPPTSPRWIPHKQHQGVTIYRYAGPPSGASPHGLSGEYMTCAPVRGSPGAVLQVLMSGTCTATVLGPAVETEVLSNCMQPDGSLKQMLRVVSEAPGWAGCLCAPREWLLELTVTREAAMHIVCLTSVDDVGCKTQGLEHSAYRSMYRTPVRGKARGTFAIAPLEGHSLDTSPETLISCIIKVDLGGACGERSASRPLADALGWRDAFLDHILLAPLLLRDAVEQARFTVKPDVLLAFPLPGPGEGAGAGAGAGREAEAGAGGVGWGPGAVDAALSRWQRDHGLAAPSGYGASLTAQGTSTGGAAAPGVAGASSHPSACAVGGRLPLSASQTPRDANGHSATAPLSGASKGLLGLIRNSLTRHSRVPSEDRGGAAAAAAAAASAAGLEDSAAALQKPRASGVRALLESSNLTDASTANGTNLSTMSVLTSAEGGVASVGLDNGKPGSSSESLPGMLGTRPSGLGVLDLEKIKRLASLDLKFWEPIHAQGKACPLRVRGKKYLEDRRKIPAGMAAFHFAAIDVITTPHVVEHVARFLPSIRQGRIPFAFVIHLIIPGTPLLGIVSTFATDRHPDVLGPPPADPEAPGHGWTPFDFVLHRFITGDTPTRNLMLKLIPHIADGSWVVKNSVGTKPVITGKALKTTYHLTPQYMEIDIDVSANQVAAYVTGLVRGATKSLVIDIGFVLEGTRTWELPEKLLGAMRVNWLDLAFAKPLDTSNELPLLPAVPVNGGSAQGTSGSSSGTANGNGNVMYSINENPLWDRK